jgi:hypothetical protein
LLFYPELKKQKPIPFFIIFYGRGINVNVIEIPPVIIQNVANECRFSSCVLKNKNLL